MKKVLLPILSILFFLTITESNADAKIYICEGASSTQEKITVRLDVLFDKITCEESEKKECSDGGGDGGQDGNWDCSNYDYYVLYTCKVPAIRTADLGNLGQYVQKLTFLTSRTTPLDMELSLSDRVLSGPVGSHINWAATMKDQQELSFNLYDNFVLLWKDGSYARIPLTCR